MKPSKRGLALLRRLGPHMEKASNKSKIWGAILIAFILFGWVGLYYQVAYGHGVTGMRDNVIWGLYIANFIFFIGISYAGAVIAGFLHLFNIEWRRPIVRIAEMIAVISTVIGPIFILLCVGRLDRLHHLALYPRLQSPIIWDVLAITTYLVGSILLLYLGMIKDFAIYRDDPNLKVDNWKRKLFRVLALNYKGTPSQKKHLSLSTTLLAIMIIPLAIIVHSVLSWIFGMTLRPGWHSTIFGPYFVLAAIYSGTGVLLVMMWLYRKFYNLYDYITEKHFVYVGYIMLALAAGYGYFTFSEYLTGWYGSEKWESEVLEKLFNPAEYGWHFLFTNVIGILLPILVVSIPMFRKSKFIVPTAALMVLALWVKRYLIIVPTLETPLLPIQDTRTDWIHYSATWPEWALTLAGIATFFIFFFFMNRICTVIPISEYGEEAESN